MRHDRALKEASAVLDGYRLSAAARRHLESCVDCRGLAEELSVLRQATATLRSEPVTAPDVSSKVLARLPSRRPRRRPWAIATGFAVGAVIGAVVAGGIAGPEPSLAGELPEAVVAGQSAVRSLSAGFSIVEHVIPGSVRTYQGELTYRSPEFLSIEVTQVDGPGTWPPNSWSLGIDGENAVVMEPFPCPILGGCTDGEPRTKVIGGRDPFSAVVPAPLDVVVPASMLRNSVEPDRFEGGDRLGRPTVAFTVSAAQARALLDAYFGVGTWREIHASDVVAVWLDRDLFVPLGVTVTATDSIDRRLWAARRGYVDDPGAPYLVVEYTGVDFGGKGRGLTMPDNASVVDAGFRNRSDLPAPVDPGMPLVASGLIEETVPARVWAWSDGRAWMRLVWSDQWSADGLFGNDGSGVQAVDMDGGPVYRAGDGGAAFLHGDGFDAVITGSVETDRMVELAAALPGARLAVPTNWPEALAPPDIAASAWRPAGLEGYAEPIVRSVGEVVLIDVFAAGERSAQITIRPATLLTPPLDPDARTVAVRGVSGRYSPMLGLLEWTEEEHSVSIGSTSLSLDELLAIAAALVKP
ncbi:MAG: hypothetical protein ACRDWH_04475 [Acidimicrobiia bacterium]